MDELFQILRHMQAAASAPAAGKSRVIVAPVFSKQQQQLRFP